MRIIRARIDSAIEYHLQDAVFQKKTCRDSIVAPYGSLLFFSDISYTLDPKVVTLSINKFNISIEKSHSFDRILLSVSLYLFDLSR